MSIPTVNSSKDDAQFNHVEQAFTTADSKISKARFSTSISQETPFQLTEGTVIIDDTDGWIEVWKENDQNPSNLITHTTLGTMKCVTDEGEIAYQGGGVWKKYTGTDGSVMVSPPDFNYNGETLTLPIMSISGKSSLAATGGNIILIDVKSLDQAHPMAIYPDPANPGIAYTNPVEQGKNIIVKIKSDYYQAWDSFIQERTRVVPEVDDTNKIIKVTLTTGAPVQSGKISSGVNTKSMETQDNYDPIRKFTITLEKRNENIHTNAYFISLHPPFGTTDPCLEIIAGRVKGMNGGGPVKDDLVLVYDYTDNRNPANPIHESFSTRIQNFFDSEDATGTINMLDINHDMVYGDLNGDGDTTDHDEDAVDDESTTWGSSETVTDYDHVTYSGISSQDEVEKDDLKTLKDVSQHYMRLMAKEHTDDGPVYDAYGTQNGHDNGHIKYGGDSDFLLQYDSNQDLKYLYVTEGTIEATLSSAG